MGTARLDPARARLQHPVGARKGDAALAPPRLGFDQLAGERVVDEHRPLLVASEDRATVGRVVGAQDHRAAPRVQNPAGSSWGRKPAASTASAATWKPAAILEGSWASLPNDTACPPSWRHQRTISGPGTR